jgi:hypothetical protein
MKYSGTSVLIDKKLGLGVDLEWQIVNSPWSNRRRDANGSHVFETVNVARKLPTKRY